MHVPALRTQANPVVLSCNFGFAHVFNDNGPTLRFSLHKLPVATVRPGIIIQAEADAIGNCGMTVEQEYVHRIGLRVRQVHFSQNLKCLRRHLA